MSRYPHPADMNPDTSDPRSPYYDDSRDEWIAERADELAEEYLRDSQKVSDSLSHFFTLGAGDVLEAALLRFYMGFDGSSNEAMAAVALELFETLDGHVSQDVKGQAELDAESERDRWEEEQEEMRSGADLRGWAA